MSDARIVLAIDPGNSQSGVCEYFMKGTSVSITAWVLPNEDVFPKLRVASMIPSILVIEAIASYGKPVGETVFETCMAIGEFLATWNAVHEYDNYARLVRRRHVMKHLCEVSTGADSYIRQALIDRFGKPGTKKTPGVLYGFKKDMWAALGLAVTYAELGDDITELYGRRE